ncbi:MAG TPA: hypothetical protein PLW86_02110 [Rhodocyclaceae bacterium]|nr:hypothetical protein [Rhodocyclaceae bacterium]
MLPVQLDFRAPPGAESRFGRILAWIGASALALAVTAYVLLMIAQRDAESDRSVQRADSRRLADADRTAAQFDPDGDIMRRLGRPWQKMLLAIESVSDEQIALLEIRPDPGRRSLRLVGEAATLDGALEYLKKLQALEVLARAHLVSYAPVPGGGIRFILQAEWVGA